MSFLAEVLNCAEKLELDTINSKVPELIRTTDNLKIDVMSYIEKIYMFSSRANQNKLLDKVKDLTNDVVNMKRATQSYTSTEVKGTLHQMKEYALELDKCEMSLTTLSKIMEVHEGLSKVKY